jgi:hypothetical protein
VKCLLLLPDFIPKLECAKRNILIAFANIKLHENTFSECLVVSYGQMDIGGECVCNTSL